MQGGPVPDGTNAEEEAALPRDEQRTAVPAGSEILGLKDGVLYWKRLLWVPNHKDLTRQILESEHDFSVPAPAHSSSPRASSRLIGRS